MHCASIRMLRGGADSPALPLELWGRVASFLALRESCMLASTCRALWAMELLSLDFQGGKTPPGGATFAPHCSCSAQHAKQDRGCHKGAQGTHGVQRLRGRPSAGAVPDCSRYLTCEEMRRSCHRLWQVVRQTTLHTLRRYAMGSLQCLVVEQQLFPMCLRPLGCYTPVAFAR